jgi:hypothetical protein
MHPASDSTRLDPEQRINVRATGQFLFRDLSPHGGLETRTVAVGENVRVERWQARDLEARGLAESV